MSKFIKLTDTSGEVIFINTRKIYSVITYRTGSRVLTSENEDFYHAVIETPEQIMEMINEQ